MKYGALCCRPFKPDQLFHPEVVEKWAPWFTENTPGNQPLGVPILIQQGDDDEVIPPSSNLAFAARLEANGENVTLQTYPGQTHTGVLDPALPAAIAWMANLGTD
jgi:acetyl esterase/lipase